MKWRTFTLLVLVGISVGLIAWDIVVYAVNKPGSGATVSEVVRDLCQAYPSIPFLAGVLAGHMLWPLPPKKRKPSRYDDPLPLPMEDT